MHSLSNTDIEKNVHFTFNEINQGYRIFHRLGLFMIFYFVLNTLFYLLLSGVREILGSTYSFTILHDLIGVSARRQQALDDLHVGIRHVSVTYHQLKRRPAVLCQ